MLTPDFAADAEVKISPKDAAVLIEKAREMVRIENRITSLKLELKEQEAKLFLMSTESVPALMRSCGVPSLPLAGGWKLEVNPVFRANLPAQSTIDKADDEEAPALIARLESGLKWLQSNKGGDIINNVITVKLGTTQGKMAAIIMRFLRSNKVSADNTKKVHPSTLTKFLREKVEAGVDIPMDTFAVFSGEIAEVVPPKQPKLKKEANVKN